MNYNCIIFDLDGTLVNTFMGILHSYEYAAKKLGLPMLDKSSINEVIGAPLTEVFKQRFGLLNKKELEKAVRYYREEYARIGMVEAECYPDMKKVLFKLKEKGKKLGVATLKNEEFAKILLNNEGLSQYLDYIAGMDGKDKLTKAMLIERVLTVMGQRKGETVLIGDSLYDAVGAKEAGISFIGVTYGFGFQNMKVARELGIKYVIQTPIELLDLI